jgi:hypothetical protein
MSPAAGTINPACRNVLRDDLSFIKPPFHDFGIFPF